jgi:hypothetical protein
MTQTDGAKPLLRLCTHEVTGQKEASMSVPFDSTYQGLPGCRRIKSKASGRSLALPEAHVQVSAHLHLREHGQPKLVSTGSKDEVLYLLYVSWLEERAFIDLRRMRDGAFVAHGIGRNEGEAFQQIEQQIATLGL